MYFTIDFSLPLDNSFKVVFVIGIENFGSNPSFTAAVNFLLVSAKKLSHFQKEMLRNLVDAYIVTVSMVLAARLRQIAEHVGLLIDRRVSQKLKNFWNILTLLQIQNEDAWMHLREDYQRLCAFIDKWDKILGYLVLTSFVSNIYLLLLQIQIVLSSTDVYERTIVIMTCSYIFLRCMTVCYTTGNVYAEGMKLIENIVLTPPDVYNSEVTTFAQPYLI